MGGLHHCRGQRQPPEARPGSQAVNTANLQSCRGQLNFINPDCNHADDLGTVFNDDNVLKIFLVINKWIIRRDRWWVAAGLPHHQVGQIENPVQLIRSRCSWPVKPGCFLSVHKLLPHHGKATRLVRSSGIFAIEMIALNCTGPSMHSTALLQVDFAIKLDCRTILTTVHSSIGNSKAIFNLFWQPGIGF